MQPDKAQIRSRARKLGIDQVGFCSWSALEADAPNDDKPARITTDLDTLMVLVKRYPTGVAVSPDASVRQYVTGRTARHLEEAAADLAYWLEELDCPAALLSAAADLRRQSVAYAGPAGQGSKLLRQAAVAAGLGSLGLNEMLLTREFGPRLFLGGVLTALDVKPDPPFDGELCLGLVDCGRCASVCPEGAIPKQAPAGATLAATRGLDADACARSTQPYGPDRMVRHLGEILGASSADEAVAKAREPITERIWFNMTVLRQGAFTGCQLCELVCPVGADFSTREHVQALEPPSITKTDPLQ